MPKIGKESFYIKGNFRTFEMWYNRENGFFFKHFPKEVFTLSTDFVNFFGASTEGILMDTTERAISQFHENSKTQKKVIFINLMLGSSYLMNQTGPTSYQGLKRGVSREFESKVRGASFERVPARGMSFEYKIYWLIDKNGLKFHEIGPNDEVYMENTSLNVSKAIYMDYTTEREQFMIGVMGTFDQLALKFIEFFSSEDLQLKIDNSPNNKLLSHG